MDEEELLRRYAMDPEELLRRYAAGERKFLRERLVGLDLSNVNLSGSAFDFGEIRDTDLRGSCLRGLSMGRALFLRCDLEGADLEGASLEGISDSNLRGANLNRCYFMPQGIIKNCDLEGATLRKTKLMDFWIEKTSLRNADLEGMTGAGLTLNEVDLMGLINFVSPAFGDIDLHNTILPDGRLVVEAYVGGDDFGRL